LEVKFEKEAVLEDEGGGALIEDGGDAGADGGETGGRHGKFRVESYELRIGKGMKA
jgi:hypothetical protein